MPFFDGPWTDWAEFTLDAEPPPPPGSRTDGPWTDWTVFSIDPVGGWADGPWSSWVQFTLDAGPGGSGLYYVTTGDTLVEMALYLAAEL